MDGVTQPRLYENGDGAEASDRLNNIFDPINRLDPRTRLIAALLLIICTIPLASLPALGLAVAIAGTLPFLARLPLSTILHRLMHVEGFMLVLLATLPFTIDGTPLVAIGPFAASREGILRAATILLKVNVSVLTILGLLGSLEPVRLGCAAARLGMPHKLVHLFLFLTRYLDILRAECGRLLDAMRIRGFAAGSNLHTWRSLGNLAGMLLVRSIERAERVDEAMRCRAFNGRFHIFTTGRFGKRDLVFAAAFTLALLLLFVADRSR